MADLELRKLEREAALSSHEEKLSALYAARRRAGVNVLDIGARKPHEVLVGLRETGRGKLHIADPERLPAGLSYMLCSAARLALRANQQALLGELRWWIPQCKGCMREFAARHRKWILQRARDRKSGCKPECVIESTHWSESLHREEFCAWFANEQYMGVMRVFRSLVAGPFAGDLAWPRKEWLR